ncbi:MAG TPA: hypothetical protein VKF81_09895, partial [Blastocatellia bacterium]|nr:hypothetical protein [Blastocatellia bacterium]
MKRVKTMLTQIAELFRGVDRSEQMLAHLQNAIDQIVSVQLASFSRDLEAQKAEASNSRLALANLEEALAKAQSALSESQLALARSEAAAEARLQATVDSMSAQLKAVSRDMQALQSGYQSRFDRLGEETARLRNMLLDSSHSLTWLAQQGTRGRMSAPSATTLVSVIMPTLNRAAVIERAL